MGKLYVVPTPVGNLEDMTFRAIRILKEADLILAEDTRTSGILLKHFEIKNAMMSHHKFNEHKTVDGIVNRIKAGETVELDDGSVLNGKDFVGEPKKGKIITILGDTRSCENSKILARDCDYLVHEATFASDSEDMAYDYFHSTTTQAARTAKAANVKNLVLTHISSRYMREDIEALLQEAISIFPNTVIAEDLSKLNIVSS